MSREIALQAKLALATEALEYYAAETKYLEIMVGGATLRENRGNRAREALARLSDGNVPDTTFITSRGPECGIGFHIFYNGKDICQCRAQSEKVSSVRAEQMKEACTDCIRQGFRCVTCLMHPGEDTNDK